MSTEFFFPSPTSRQWLRVGPLAGDLDGFATRLKAEGYARPSAVSKLRLVSNLSRWLGHQGLGVEALDEPCIEAFLLTRGPRCAQRGEAKTARQLLSHLRANARVPPASSPPDNDSPLGQIERRYERCRQPSARARSPAFARAPWSRCWCNRHRRPRASSCRWRGAA